MKVIRYIFIVVAMVFPFVSLISCSPMNKEIPIKIQFDGSISKYYSVKDATVKFTEDKRDLNTIVELDLVRNSTPFKVNPGSCHSMFFFGGDRLSYGEWILYMDVQNVQHDHLCFCESDNASKLFQYYKKPGNVCHLSFKGTIGEENISDVKRSLRKKQQLFFELHGFIDGDDN